MVKKDCTKRLTPTKYSRLCSLHFKVEDFREDSSDQTQSRKRRRKDIKLLNRRLKKDAIPSIFSGLPSYFAFDDVHS